MRLAIFDTRGKLVTILAEGLRVSGRHQEIWDGCDALGRPVSSGAYLAVLDFEGTLRTRKVLLAR
jgi:hypothetical protein